MVVAHNLTAMNAQRQFNIVGNSKKKSIEKLSSGYRINRAADDAAGLAISEKMRRQIRGLTQGSLNAQDGISLCQVADGALEEVNDMLHRITELSVKAANGTNTQEDRNYINQEVRALVSEIERITETTTFNEKQLFVGEEIIDPNAPPTPLTAYERQLAIQASYKIYDLDKCTASLTDNEIITNDHGFSINNNYYFGFDWDTFKDSSGVALDKENIIAGDYTCDIYGLKFGITIPENTKLSDLKTALNGIEYTINSNRVLYTAIKCENVKIENGTHTDELINAGKKAFSSSFFITAEGMQFFNAYLKSKGAESPLITWAQLGIDDYTTAQGKSFHYEDPVSGFSFDGTIADDATPEEILNAHRMQNISYSTYRNISLPGDPTYYPAKDIQQTNVAATYDTVSIKNVSSYRTYGNEFAALGYTSAQDKFKSINATIELTKDASGNPIARVTDKASGNYYDLAMTSISDIGSTDFHPKVQFGDAPGATLIIELNKGYISDYNQATNPTGYAGLLNYLGTVGEVVSDMTIPGIYTLHADIGSPYRTSYTLRGIDKPDIEEIPEDIPEAEKNIGPQNIWIHTGPESELGLNISIDPISTKTLGIRGITTKSAESSLRAIDATKRALEKVSKVRSDLGAQQNRLEHTVKNLNNVVENTQASESAIRDTDMAKELVEIAKFNILDQAGVAMMSQANQMNQSVLSLLG